MELKLPGLQKIKAHHSKTSSFKYLRLQNKHFPCCAICTFHSKTCKTLGKYHMLAFVNGLSISCNIHVLHNGHVKCLECVDLDAHQWEILTLEHVTYKRNNIT